jgi:Glycosyltransferase family 87
LVVWSAVLLGLSIRILANPNRATAFTVYRLAGLHWFQGEYLYGDWRGFVYSPLAAAFFCPFALIPPGLGNLFWTWYNATLFLAGLAAILNSGIYPEARRHQGLVYLLILPLVLGNLDTGQANPTLTGLILLAVVAVPRDQWSLAAFSIAAAAYLKIYPLAVGLLLCLLAPKKLGWRLILALLLLGFLPFVFQHWSYVAQQYHEWIVTRSADDRRLYPLKDVPLDLWFLLVRFGHLPFPGFLYTLFQLLSGGAIALYCEVGVWKQWPREQILVGLFSLVCIWMTLCGPATESLTYVLLAPAVVLALVEAGARFSARPRWLRAGLVCTYALLVLAVARASFLPSQKGLWVLAVQPVAAVVFAITCLGWLMNSKF